MAGLIINKHFNTIVVTDSDMYELIMVVTKIN